MIPTPEDAQDADAPCRAESAERANESLIEMLKAQFDIDEPRLEAAFRQLPRHLFLRGVDLERVYEDAPIMTRETGDSPSSCSQPAVVARLLSMMQLESGARILEIGAGTGWAAGLMGHMVGPQGSVTTIDITEEVAAGARGNLAGAGVENVTVIAGDGGVGYAAGGPYDAILATVGVWDIPPQWLDQLKVGGRIVLPFWLNTQQFGVAFVKGADDNSLKMAGHCGYLGFMRLRGAFAGEESYYRENDFGIDSEIASTERLKHLVELIGQGGRRVEFPLAETHRDRKFFCEYLALTNEPYIGVHDGKDRIGFSFGNGIVVGESIAVLPTRSRDPDVLNTVVVFGGDEALVALRQLVERWKAAGEPALWNIHMTARPVSSEAVDSVAPDGVATFRKRWMEYEVWWEAAGDGA